MGFIRNLAKLAFVSADLFLPTPSGPRILIYHQVGGGLGRQMEVTVEDFEWQLNWLAENREVVDLETAVSRWDEPGSDQLVVLTFDDGYRDVYTTAFPMLWELNMPFTLYLATEPIETGKSPSGSELDKPMTWPMVREMSDSGLTTVGSHTHSHLDLRSADEEAIRRELDVSDELIATNLELTPRHFAYPWGYWADKAHNHVASRYATAALGAPVRQSPFDPHFIHRFPIQLSDGRRWFEPRLRGGLLAEERVRRVLRGFRGP